MFGNRDLGRSHSRVYMRSDRTGAKDAPGVTVGRAVGVGVGGDGRGIAVMI
jgi:hypothetical protein